MESKKERIPDGHAGAIHGTVIGPASVSAANPTTQVFDGFPYLVVRLAPAVYFLALVPVNVARTELAELARRQAVANGLSTCLAFGLCDGVFCEPDGSVQPRDLIPRGGTQVTGPLRLGHEFEHGGEMAARAVRLAAYLRSRLPKAGYVMGDLTKGGRPATAAERDRLAGAQKDGVPRGLERCAECGEWRGECLDTNPAGRDWVVHVKCRCGNESRCARCGGLLCDRALNANYYEESTGRVVHVPGFGALGHSCPGDSTGMDTAP